MSSITNASSLEAIKSPNSATSTQSPNSVTTHPLSPIASPSITLVTDPRQANAITHSADMHADEVLATAILSLIIPLKIFRTKDRSLIPHDYTVFIYDIGGEYNPATLRFDHHQCEPLRQAAQIRRFPRQRRHSPRPHLLCAGHPRGSRPPL